ncbi:MAG: hypothetical protein M3Y58_13940, partial [Chloroflexota bacterium]|nr:hypothetical protein [Chloroflexota bacterium]
MRHKIVATLRGGRPFIPQLLIIGAIIAGTVFVSDAVRPISAPVAAQADTPQFRLPFAEPPGP